MEIYCSVDGKVGKLGYISDIELTPEEEEIAERLSTEETFSFSISESEQDKLLRSMLGQSSYNSMKLKQDGYLSPKNGWFTPIENTDTVKLMEKIAKERGRHDKERERCTKERDKE